jgi:predicted nucleic acid-binding protein
MAEPLSLSTGIISLLAVALKLVVGTLGLIDKTVAAHQEAANELKNLQEDLEDLHTQMVRIHGTLEVLTSNTKDRGFKKVLQEYVQGCQLIPGKYTNPSFSHHGNTAIAELCTALDGTFIALEGLTDQTKAEESKLYSLALPNDAKSLAFAQAILRNKFAPSQMTDLLQCLRDMRSEIQKCLRKLDTAFQHTWNLYNAMTNGLARVGTNVSVLSTSTTLTARIKLVDWLKRRDETWNFSRPTKGVISEVSSIPVMYSNVLR